jgi:hypothetical protein
MSADRVVIMKAFLDAFNRHDVDEIMSYFVEDCEFDTPRGPAPRGRQLRGKREARGESLIDSVGSRTSATATTSLGVRGQRRIRVDLARDDLRRTVARGPRL